MVTDNRYDREVVDGATNFQKKEIAVSDHSSPTDKSISHQEAVYRYTHREVNREVYREVDQDSTEVEYQQGNDEVDWMVTKADFQRRHLVMQHL